MKLERSDITDFPSETIEMVLDLQKEGWRAQRSNRNHIMLLAPDGVTRLSASRNAGSPKYLADDIRKYKAGESNITPEQAEEKAEVTAVPKKFPCPQKDCRKFYTSQEKINVHIAVDHEGYLKCPDCDETRQTNQKLSIHRAHAHGYVSPRKAQRKEQEAKRKKQEVINKVVVDTLEGKLPNGYQETEGTLDMQEQVVERIIERGDIATNAKFDPDILQNRLPSGKIMDSMPASALIPNFSPLKNFKPVDKKTESTDKDIDFIDERDSWALNLESIMDMDIRTVARVLHAAGLKLELRSWKEKE